MPDNAYRLLIKELPEEERPRERLILQGASALSNAELIAISLRSGTSRENALSLATHLLAEFHGLSGLAHASIKQLCEVPGIGPVKAAQLMAALELGKRLVQYNDDGRLQVTSSEDAARFFQPSLSIEQQENLYVMLLDTKHHSFRPVPIYLGNVNSISARPSEVFREAIKDNATAIIIAHNHPSGDPEPSPEDISLTKELSHLGRQWGIELLDHIIIGHKGYYSLKQHGLVPG
jgi:DNA repair protein RadC